MIYTNTL